LTSRIAGRLDEATIRFPSAFYATLGVVLLYLFTRRIYGADVGLTAGAILATTLIFGSQAIDARVDERELVILANALQRSEGISISDFVTAFSKVYPYRLNRHGRGR